MNNPKQVQAAADLEERLIEAKEIVKLLREGQHPAIAYAMVYALRAEISKIVRTLGAGTPTAHQADKASLALVSSSYGRKVK
jgi:hypothetical protein